MGVPAEVMGGRVLETDDIIGLGLRRHNAAVFNHFYREVQSGAIHCIAFPVKDLPRVIPDDLEVVAYLPRQEHREAIVTSQELRHLPLEDLPEGTVVSTMNRRRCMQLQAKFPHLVVETEAAQLSNRLRRVAEGAIPSTMAAGCELKRQEFPDAAIRLVPEEQIMPAWGQGLVGILCTPLSAVGDFLVSQDDQASRVCAECERYIHSHVNLFEAACGGIATIEPDGQLRVRAALALPGAAAGEKPMVKDFELIGHVEDGQEMAEQMVKDVNLVVMDTLMGGPQRDSRALTLRTRTERPPPVGLSLNIGNETRSTSLFGPWERWSNSGRQSADREEFPPIYEMSERLMSESLSRGEFVLRSGRVTSVLENGSALVDVDYSVPAFWQSEASSGQTLKLGTAVKVYCVSTHRHRLLALLHEPPRLIGCGRGRVPLSDLKTGAGPFRAVVVSHTESGTLVDINCEVLADLNDEYEELRTVGEEMDVFVLKADIITGSCMVCLDVQPSWERPEPMRLSEVERNSAVPYYGTVQRLWGRRAVVDFNCEVEGILGPADVDSDVWPGGLSAGDQVKVYVTETPTKDSRARLSMFPSGLRRRIPSNSVVDALATGPVLVPAEPVAA